MAEEEPSAEKLATPAIILGFFVSLVVTGAIVLPIIALSDWLETSGIFKIPDCLAAPPALFIVGIYIGIAQGLAALFHRRFFD
jgi:hypothetical protein